MDTPERAPISIAAFAFLTAVGMAAVIGVLAQGWSAWKADDHVMIWLAPGGLLLTASITWYVAIVTLSQLNPRLPDTHDGNIVLQAPTSMRLPADMAVVGVVLLAMGSVPAVVGGLDTDEVPMTAYRWALLAALIAVFLVVFLAVAFMWRATRIRFVGDHQGLSWDRFLRQSRVTLPWRDIRGLEKRGRSFTARWVVVTNDGRELRPIAFDPSVPLSTEANSRLAVELEALRRA